MTDGQRQIISTAVTHAEAEVRNNVAQIEAEAYEIAKQNGMTVVIPSYSDIAAFKAASGPVYEVYKNRAGALGAQLIEAASGL